MFEAIFLVLIRCTLPCIFISSAFLGAMNLYNSFSELTSDVFGCLVGLAWFGASKEVEGMTETKERME